LYVFVFLTFEHNLPFEQTQVTFAYVLAHIVFMKTLSISSAALKGMIFHRHCHQNSNSLREVAINPSLAFQSY